MIGFDYGIKPRIMVIADINYPSLIHDAKVVAVGYGILPHFGLIPNQQFVSLIFENREKGQECFRHFKGWTDASQDSNAIVLSFIEEKDGGYRVCIYPEFELLLKRCIPDYMRSEIDPLFMVPICFPIGIGKTSQDYFAFKAWATKNPFVFCGGSKQGELFLDLAIQKRNVGFFQGDNIPETAPEKIYKELHNKEQSTPKKPLLDKPEEIFSRRKLKLKTYFPISIAKLYYIEGFIKVKDKLLDIGYKEWQIVQASCNLILSNRMLKKLFFEGVDEKSVPSNILDYLLSHFEEFESIFPDDEIFTFENLRQQMKSDMRELLSYIGSHSIVDENDMLKELRNHNLL